MDRRGWMSILAVAAVAAISGLLLMRLMAGDGALGNQGLAGVFLASMLSHLTVVARDMFIPLFLPLASVYHPLVLGAAAGFGGAIGEVTTYFLGWGVAESIEPATDAEDRVARWIGRYGLWAVLLVSMTPLPDTPLVMLAGSRRLPFRKLLAVELAGKTALYSVGAVVGGLVYSGLEGTLGSVVTSGIMVVASLIFCVAVTWKPSRDLLFGWLDRMVSRLGR